MGQTQAISQPLLADIEPAGVRRRRSSIRSWAKRFSLREANDAADEGGPPAEGGRQRPSSFVGLVFQAEELNVQF